MRRSGTASELMNYKEWGGIPGTTEMDIAKYLESGHIKQAICILRDKTEITTPELIQKICDCLDPDKPKLRGRPASSYDIVQQKKLRLMIICYYLRRAAYTKKGNILNPAERAKGEVIEKFKVYDNLFINALAKFNKTYKVRYIQFIIKTETPPYQPRHFFDDDLDDDKQTLLERNKLLEWAWHILT